MEEVHRQGERRATPRRAPSTVCVVPHILPKERRESAERKRQSFGVPGFSTQNSQPARRGARPDVIEGALKRDGGRVWRFVGRQLHFFSARSIRSDLRQLSMNLARR